MACHMGKDGVVKVTASGGSATTIGHVRNWSLDETVDTLEATAMGDAFKEYCIALKDWSGSIDVLWDPADVGQGIIAVGAQLVVALYPEGVSGALYAGSIIVTGVSTSAAYDGLVESSVTFQGTGALTYTP